MKVFDNMVVAGLLALAPTMALAERPNLYPVEKLEQKYLDTEDITYLGTATSRCAAHYLTFSVVAGQNDQALGEKLEGVSFQYYQLAQAMYMLKRIENNTDGTNVEAQLQSEISGYMPKYTAWFTANWYEYASYYEEDKALQDEVEACGRVSALAQAEMMARLESMEADNEN